MFIFLPPSGSGGLTKCGEGAITRYLYWGLVMIVGLSAMDFFHVKDIYQLLFGTIIIVGATLHTIIYVNLYDKKKRRNKNN